MIAEKALSIVYNIRNNYVREDYVPRTYARASVATYCKQNNFKCSLCNQTSFILMFTISAATISLSFHGHNEESSSVCATRYQQ